MSSLLVLAATVGLTDAVSSNEQARRAPRFPTSRAGWIGTPVTWEALRGRVVMLDVWTFG